MLYYFKHKNALLAVANLIENTWFELVSVYVDIQNPVFYMLKSVYSFNKWVNDRQGLARPFSADIMKQGDIRTIKGFVDVSLCLSLHDCFWLSSNQSDKWENFSLFRHKFSKVYTEIASGQHGFTGKVLKTPSPEFSVLGTSCKFFKRHHGEIYLYKTCGWINELEYSGVYAEYFVSQLLTFLDIKDAVTYDIVQVDGKLYSRCKVFTSESINLIDMEDIVEDCTHLDDHISFYDRCGLGDDFRLMMIIDSLVVNIDRHCENLALLFNDNYKIVGLAPIFDFDHSLFYDMPLIVKDSKYALRHYKRYEPKTWVNHTFEQQASLCCTPQIYEKLHKIRGRFEFANHPKFPINCERLYKINKLFHYNYERIMKTIQYR